MSQTQATQPEVANYITDIFGADSDDELEATNAPAPRPPISNFADLDRDDEELQDSDDDAPVKPNRLKSASSQSQSRDKVDSSDPIEDSDEEDAAPSQKKKKTLKKKRKEGRGDSNGKEDSSKIKKRRQSSSSSSAKKPISGVEKGDDAGAGSGDEYDSGDDVKRTADDDKFIDEDDDMADVRGEYDAEEQVFDDERPDDYDKKKPKGGRGGGGVGSSGGGSRKAADPFSETLEAMKKPKAVLMSEAEKDKVTERLLQRMHEAFLKDEVLFKAGEPAVHKLQMLKTVQQMVAVKTLQHNLLEKDILGSFKDWIEPKRDASKTLPSLTVRSAIYEMLAKLPCQTDHLKRTDGDKKPIGYTILALRKHKMETPENKRALKELMEKWCRPVFRKVGHEISLLKLILIFYIISFSYDMAFSCYSVIIRNMFNSNYFALLLQYSLLMLVAQHVMPLPLLS